MLAFKKFNFFIGPNNAGKSTVLTFISRYLPARVTSGADSIDPLERHLDRSGDNRGATVRMAIGIHSSSIIEAALIRVPESDKPRLTDILERLLHQFCEEGIVWFGGEVPYKKLDFMMAPVDPDLQKLITGIEWNVLWASLTGQMGGSLEQSWIPQVLEKLRDAVPFDLPATRIIPAIRQIGGRGAEFGDYSGVGLIDRLAEVQAPDHNRRENRTIFDRINGFLQEVTSDPEAQIEIPHNREHVLVHMNGRILPLRSLGTGIEEVIMIAAFCTISDRKIVCIEEPEIHLHPLLQRKLVGYLERQTTNQYFIATHSASFIDTPGAAIFHVRLEDGMTRIDEAILKRERHAICMDLAQRASDIIQSNCVIWVEGPSDRLYIKHWIRALADDLREGLHYSIMFYGGRLLSHLAANDDEVEDFIQLRDLNRHLAIVMDSDKPSAQSKVNATKRRLESEFSAHGGIAWITKGREIENYLDHSELQRAVAIVYGAKYGKPRAGGPYDHALHFQRSQPKRTQKPTGAEDLIEREVDKVKVARAACAKEADLDVLDLRVRIGELVELIRTANSP